MGPKTYLTTSWDDGHPLNLRVAELLTKYGLRGTFYVPMGSENETMTVSQIRELSADFEIGAHTLYHTTLTAVADQFAWQEIDGARTWLQDLTGVTCLMFCPPGGKYARRHLGMVQRAGYIGLRTVELLSFDLPRVIKGVAVMPTTCQAFPHHANVYVRSALRRGNCATLWRYILNGCPSDWDAVVRLLLGRAIHRGGVFHFWGHSCELKETAEWQRLEDVLRTMRDVSIRESRVTNGQLCEWPVSDVGRAGKV
jgi:hypothetical protein